MTVAVPNVTAYSYNGNGVTTEFSFPLRFLTDDDLLVVLVDADGVETEQELDVDYTVTGAGEPSGGSIAFLVAPDAGTDNVLIKRLTLPTQLVDFGSGSRVPGDTLEEQLDRFAMALQEVDRRLSEVETTPGPAGVSAFRFGTGAPDVSLGEDGDIYWDDATGNVYSKQGGAWTLEDTVTGPTGSGAIWRFGAGAPSAGLGSDGDAYLNTTNYDVYSKAAGAWTLGGNIKGANGAGSGDMLAANNLSDLADKPAAFSNIKQAGSESATGVWEAADGTEAAALSSTTLVLSPGRLGGITWSDTQKALAARATQAEAQAGSVNTKAMSPLRTAEAIAAQVPALVGWEHISGGGTNGEFEGTSVATLDFEGLGLSAFRHLWLTGWARPATDNVRLYLRTSIDDGVTYDAGGTDYYWVSGYNVTAGAHGTDQATAAQIDLGDSIGNDATDGMGINAYMWNFNQAMMMHGHSQVAIWHQSGYMLERHAAWSRRQATARNAFRLLMSSGNIAAYNFHLFGIRG